VEKVEPEIAANAPGRARIRRWPACCVDDVARLALVAGLVHKTPEMGGTGFRGLAAKPFAL